MAPPPSLYEAIVCDDELVDQWQRLGFVDPDAWLAWRLAALGIPASVHAGQVAVRAGHLTVERIPERKATRYAWLPPA